MAMARLLVATWFSLLASAAAAHAGEAVLFACAAGDLHFTVESSAVVEAVKPEAGVCARLTHANGAVLTVAAVRTADVKASIATEEKSQRAVWPTLEHRTGDPIALGAQTVEVHKHFAPADADAAKLPFVSSAWVKAGDDLAVQFRLAAPTRATHDAVYQELRRFVRTYRALTAGATTH